MRQKILNSKYFRIKSDVYIDERTMDLLTLFFGLLGVPNFITKRYLQGVVHLILFSLMILGVVIFGGYFVSMPWGPILVTVSYALAFFETKAYNRQVNGIKGCETNPARDETCQLEADGNKDGGIGFVEKMDRSFRVSAYSSATLSFFIVLCGLLGIWSSIGPLKQGGHVLVLEGLFLIFIGVVIIILFAGVWRCRENMALFKAELLRFDRFTKKHKDLLKSVGRLFACDIVIIIIIVFLFLYMCII